MQSGDFARLRYYKPAEIPNWDKVDFTVVWTLERLIDKIGHKPVVISSWRSISKNEDVGGASDSQHLVGKALDTWWGSDVSLAKVYDVAFHSQEWGGIGLYYPENTMHLDVGPKNQLGITRQWSRIGGKGQPYVAASVALEKLKSLVKSIDPGAISAILFLGILLSRWSK